MSDVCLILEGTYPYVSGGVSSWVYTMIKELRDINFSILYIGAHRGMSKKLHYEIPSNVVDFREVYLFDYRVEQEKTNKRQKDDYDCVRRFLKDMKSGKTESFEDIIRVVGDARTRSISLYDLVHSFESWEIVEQMYKEEKEETPFVDYFWTWRFLHLPLFSILRMDIPEARTYHAISTGYAGLLGALCKLRFQRPFLLTEHGIYTRERKIEIARADWIYSAAAQEIKVMEGQDFFKDWWSQLFIYLSQLTYDHADKIITLYGQNQRVQIEEGADPQKTSIIPNGVRLPGEDKSVPREASAPFKIGFVGRVVPIKDVKTFLMACRTIYEEIKDVEIYILGPTDEDEDYFRQCVLLADMQGLSSVVKFKGKVNVKDYYEKLDLIVLTSISEAQPLVILEAHAYSIPVVATDVGACFELLNGGTPDDKLLGASGIVTPICDAEATARAVIRILREPGLRKKMGAVGYTRTKTYYQLDDLLASYQNIYSHCVEEIRWPA